MNEIYIKCIISFAVGILFLQMISSVCRCNNKDIVEGAFFGDGVFFRARQGDGLGAINKELHRVEPDYMKKEADMISGAVRGVGNSLKNMENQLGGHDSGWCVDSGTGQPEKPVLKTDCETHGEWFPLETPGVCYDDESHKIVNNAYDNCGSKENLLKWVELHATQSNINNLHTDYESANTVMKDLFSGEAFSKNAAPHITFLSDITNESNKKDINLSINKFSDFGSTAHDSDLNYLEKLIINFINKPSKELYNNIKMQPQFTQGRNPCNTDMTIYILVFFLYLYGIDSDNKLDGTEYQKLLVIHDRLTKYIPDVLEKIQQIYEENCDGQPDPLKQKMLNNIYSKLLKNNVTTISFTGFEQITKKLDNIKTVYIVIFMICVTFIAVKFMGMFNMSLNV